MPPPSTSASNLLKVILGALNAANMTGPIDPGFNISSVAATARVLPTRSWELGSATSALLEFGSPLLSVFGPSPFPVPTMDPAYVPALTYAQEKIVIGTGIDGLAPSAGATGDPVSLGIAAIMLGKSNQTFASAAASELDFILNTAPRWANGAISQRGDVAELWCDEMAFVPPFIAFYAADTQNLSLLETAYTQCGLYRQVLLFGDSSTTFAPANTSKTQGLWSHIVGPQNADPGLWSTGNAWAAVGMARVFATITKTPLANETSWYDGAVSDLTSWIQEILDGAMASPKDGGLLRNYLNDTVTGHGFGEISGSSLLASVAYRMAVHAPETFGAKYVAFADGIRATLGGVDAAGLPHITVNGTATPAVNPLAWGDAQPFTSGSPEGNNFVVLLYSAWRDCFFAGICTK